MGEYINAAMKEVVLCVAGCQGFMDTLYETTPEKLLPVRKYIKTIKTLSEKILECCESGIDKDQLVSLLRWADNCELLVVPRTDTRAGKKYMIVDGEVIERIVKNSLFDCSSCLKLEADVKKCQLRKDLLQCGVMARPNNRGHCPFQP